MQCRKSTIKGLYRLGSNMFLLQKDRIFNTGSPDLYIICGEATCAYALNYKIKLNSRQFLIFVKIEDDPIIKINKVLCSTGRCENAASDLRHMVMCQSY